MKKIFSMAVMAIALVAAGSLSSCNKDDDNSGNNNNSNTGTNTDCYANVAGRTYQFNADLSFDDFGEASFNARYINPSTPEASVHFSAGVAWESIGKTINLAVSNPEDSYWMRYEDFENTPMFTQNDFYGSVYSDYTDNNTDETYSEPIFASGTLTTEHIEGGYTLAIDGTLKNGTSVQIRLKIAYTEAVIPLTRNSLIYDGVKYEISNGGATRLASGSIQFGSFGNSGTPSVTGHIGNPIEVGVTYFLNEYHNGSSSADYPYDFAIQMDGLEMSYNLYESGFACTINGNEVSEPFTDGEASMSVYNGMMSFMVRGTLYNGKQLKLYLYSAVDAKKN